MAAGARSLSRCLRPLSVFLGLSVLLVSIPSFQGDAFAQELIRRQNLFDRLFGGPPPRQALPPPGRDRQAAPRTRQAPAQRAAPRQRSAPPARQQSQRSAQPARQQPQSSRNAAQARSAPSPEPEAEKLENAHTVLIVGDFMANGLAEGLQTAYAESPGTRIVNRSNGSSGFVRDDFYDWNEQLEPILEDVEPAVIVVMIGSNDRQALTVNGQSARPLSEPWREVYSERVTEFAQTIEAADIPLIWTGLPPFRSSSMSSDMLAFNDIYKKTVEAVGGQFVDIWEGFVDESGSFTTTGPDMNGQSVQLRAGDGINMTHAGRRKIAFFVEKPLNRLLGPATEPGLEQLDTEILVLPSESTDEPLERDRTPPVSLAAPQIGSPEELAGNTPLTSSSITADQTRSAGHPGRADNFSLRQNTSQDAAEEEEDPGATSQQME
ncbi:DUF459 domain-containing protein [Chelativorans sp. YIM 93263]|uniref:DUF459 domain-containing protein n=1 Tax=Chelativorans sp. YIM 93263 TaxID=2906648 RepID=UPI00237935B1|nr:DUF459 domain-containing protein [Chelativorans sp. YIM 93263]